MRGVSGEQPCSAVDSDDRDENWISYTYKTNYLSNLKVIYAR